METPSDGSAAHPYRLTPISSWVDPSERAPRHGGALGVNADSGRDSLNFEGGSLCFLTGMTDHWSVEAARGFSHPSQGSGEPTHEPNPQNKMNGLLGYARLPGDAVPDWRSRPCPGVFPPHPLEGTEKVGACPGHSPGLNRNSRFPSTSWHSEVCRTWLPLRLPPRHGWQFPGKPRVGLLAFTLRLPDPSSVR
jgi:hypothetical protein